MRKLASVQEIIDVVPITKADRIELATVLGWQVVIGKGEFKKGDRVVYCEIDSIFPKELAEKIGFTDKYLKTRRFRGVYSQGMCLPLSAIPSGNGNSFKVGDDVTELLGITKHEADERNDNQWEKKQRPNKWYMRFAAGRWFWKKFLYKPISAPFPTDLVPKTDETRVQVLQDILDKYAGVPCDITEKVDGSSITFWLDKQDKLHVCSRNREILNTEDFMYQTVEKLRSKIMALPLNVIMQGEIIGPGIQGNKYNLDDYRILLYQCYMPNVGYLAPLTFRSIAYDAGLECVPRIEGKHVLERSIEYYVSLSKGTSQLADVPREGIVIRPLSNVTVENDSRFVDGRLSFKSINPAFLVKYEI